MNKVEYFTDLAKSIEKDERRMNDDTISRQAAIDTVMKFMPSLTTPDGCGQFDKEIYEAQEMFVDIGQALNDLPSAERHGRWIENETSYADHPTKQTCNCSVCKRASTRPLGDWCRWCGSRMDLDGDTE